MANEVITRVYWTQIGDPTMKSVLISLADQANDNGFCYPCIETIAQRTEWTPRCVKEKLKKLEQEGWLKRRPRLNRSTQYIINVDRLVAEKPEGYDRKKATGPWEEGIIKKQSATGEPGAPDLFATGERHSGTGEPGSMTGERPSPITLNEPSLEPSYDIGENDFASNSEMVDWVANEWNRFAQENPAVAAVRLPLATERRDAILKRTHNVCKDGNRRAFWAEFFGHLRQSRFLRGLVPPTGNYKKPFSLKMNWALTASHFNDIMDGQVYGRNHEGGEGRVGGKAMAAADRFATGVDAGRLRRNGS